MSQKHEPALDGLRAIAALAVLAWHDWQPWASGGSLGVDMFFVLSGYLITSIIWRELETSGKLDFRRFMERRARRLLPAFLLMLAVYVAACPLLNPGQSADRWQDAFTAALYVMNLRMAVAPHNSALMHTWSLAGEVQFYLVFPLVLVRLSRLPRQRVALGLLATWLTLTSTRLIWERLGGSGAISYYTPLFHSTGLILGASLALSPPAIRVGRAGLFAVLMLLAMGGTRTGATYPYVAPLAELATALVVLDPPRALAWRPLELAGRVSYGIYLWQLPLFFMLGSAGRPLPVMLLTTATLAAATTSYLLVERRFLVGRTQTPQPAPARA